MIFQAVLNNPKHPEFGEVTLPFPIPEKEYTHCLELLAPMGLDDPLEQQCNVLEIRSEWQTLSQLQGAAVNMDELDYLAKRLDSFDVGEFEQFSGMSHLMQLHDVKDFINLTFCCQTATVISNFSDLRQIGQSHYMNTHGGGAPLDVLKKLDGEKLARDLIASGSGKITPYGVVFDNGMELERCYQGNAFPGYLYLSKVLDIEIDHPGETPETTLLQLPMPKDQLDRMLFRGDFDLKDEFPMRFIDAHCPGEVFKILEQMDNRDTSWESVRELNRMCAAIEALPASELKKLDAVVSFVQPEYPFQIRHLAENLDQFEFVPGVKNNEEYGRYMIQDSEHFEYDPELEPYYDYEKYGADHLAWHEGKFTEYGLVSYFGTLSLDELIMEDPSGPEEDEGLQMGGLT